MDGGYFGDDYGAQAGLLFSPATWRSLVKPRLARLFAPFVERGLPVLMHSDGRIDEIVPGPRGDRPDGPQPGPAGGPRSRLAAHHVRRPRLAFYGGISTQTVLPQGTTDEVREAVDACRAGLAPDGTGLLLAPSHRLMADIPMANVEAMLDAFAQHG